MRDLHRRLYGSLWEWGGKFRLFQTNIGIAPEQIAVQHRSEMDNLRHRWEEVHDLDSKTLGLLAHVAVVASFRLEGRVGPDDYVGSEKVEQFLAELRSRDERAGVD